MLQCCDVRVCCGMVGVEALVLEFDVRTKMQVILAQNLHAVVT